jgi:hypothetical protein
MARRRRASTAASVPLGTSYCTAAPNSVGPGATITAIGSGVVAQQDLGLVAQGGPAGFNLSNAVSLTLL